MAVINEAIREYAVRQLASEVAELEKALAGKREMLSAWTGGRGIRRAATSTVEASSRGARRRNVRMSAAARKAVSVRMRKYWAEKRKAAAGNK